MRILIELVHDWKIWVGLVCAIICVVTVIIDKVKEGKDA